MNILPLLPLAILPPVVIAILILMSYRQLRMVNSILTSLGVKPKKFLLSSQLKESYKGETLRLKLDSGSASLHQIQLTISLQCPVGFDLNIERGNRGILSSVLDSGFSIRAEELGSEYNIESKEPSIVNELLSNRHTLNLIKNIFHLGAEYLYCDGEQLSVELNIAVKDPTRDLSHIKELVDNLIQFKEDLIYKARQHAQTQFGQPFAGKAALYFIYGLPVILGISSIILAVVFGSRIKEKNEPLHNMQFIIKSVIIFSPLLFLYLLVAYKFLKARYSSIARKFSNCLVLGIAWLFCTFPLIQELNGYLDRSVPEKISGTVIYKSAGEGQSYYLHIAPAGVKISEKTFDRLIGSVNAVKISVERHEYLKATSGRTHVDYYVKKGFFNIPRIVGYKIREPAQNDKDHM
jgi:hypothetical protein